jgi:hypothetical protein
MEDVCSGWDKKWNIVQTVNHKLDGMGLFSDASMAEWNFY